MSSDIFRLGLTDTSVTVKKGINNAKWLIYSTYINTVTNTENCIKYYLQNNINNFQNGFSITLKLN